MIRAVVKTRASLYLMLMLMLMLMAIHRPPTPMPVHLLREVIRLSAVQSNLGAEARFAARDGWRGQLW
jgi:hypothetical protein